MNSNITRIHPEHVREYTIPDALQKIDDADSAFIITMTGGKWSFQSIKNDKSHFELVGLLQCISGKLVELINK